jgi:hypothetical protein
MNHTITTPQPIWDKQPTTNLQFIKSNLRYPLSFKNTASILFSLVSLVLTAVIVLLSYLYIDTNSKSFYFFWILAIIPFIITFIRAKQALYFLPLQTNKSITENQELISKFLQQQQLMVYKHQTLPQLFQIISKPLSASSKQREVMLFIADESRILINSHYNNAGFLVITNSKLKKHMLSNFMEWLQTAK